MNHDAPVPWRLRSDLTIVPADGTSGAAWVVKDPLRLRYFRLRAEEMALLKLLDGRTTWGEILMILQTGFPRTRFSEQNLVQFLVSTINNALLVSNRGGHGDRLASMARTQRKGALSQRLGSIIAVRWHGIDPTHLLVSLNRTLGWLFHPTSLVAALTFVIGVAAFMVSRIDEIMLEVPRISQFVTVENLPYLMLAFVFVKVLHELGHGLACHRGGGECHELGVLFIAFLPLMYCDVSDAWLFRSRWRRVFVSAAGIVVELCLAAVFAVLWMLSVPGPLHTFFLNVAVIASVNTLLVNGNPLLRYDGYYVLADGLGKPNLGPESRRAAAQFFDRTVLGIRHAQVSEGSWLGEAGYILFGTASALYRFVVLGFILWVVYQTLEPYGLELIAQMLIVASVAGVAVSGIRTVQSRSQAIQASGSSKSRGFFGLTIFLGLVALGLLIPLPRSVAAPFTVTPGRCTPVYVSVAGQLRSSVTHLDAIQAGEEIARLSNTELERQLAKAEGDLKSRREHLTQLQNRRLTDPRVAESIPTAREAIVASERQLAALEQAADELRITSTQTGVVWPPRNSLQFAADSFLSAASPKQWSGRPLDATNQAAWLDERTLLCWVGPEAAWRLEALVPQTEIPLVRPGADVDVTFSSAPGVRVTGTVERVEARPVQTAPRELVIAQQIAVDGLSDPQPLETYFRADIIVASASETSQSTLYSTGKARIRCEKQSLAYRLWRLICHTFAINV